MKKLLSLILVLSLILTMIPGTALAADGQNTTFELMNPEDVPEAIKPFNESTYSVYSFTPAKTGYYEVYGSFILNENAGYNYYITANVKFPEEGRDYVNYRTVASCGGNYDTQQGSYWCPLVGEDEQRAECPVEFTAGQKYYVIIAYNALTISEIGIRELPVKTINIAPAEGGSVYNDEAYYYWYIYGKKQENSNISKPTPLGTTQVWGDVFYLSVEADEGYTFMGMAAGENPTEANKISFWEESRDGYINSNIQFSRVSDGGVLTPIFVREDGESGEPGGDNGDNPGFQPDAASLCGMTAEKLNSFESFEEVTWDDVYAAFGDVRNGDVIYPVVLGSDGNPALLTGEDVTVAFELQDGTAVENAPFEFAKDDNGFWTITCNTDDAEIYKWTLIKGDVTYGPTELGVNIWLDGEVTKAALISEAVNATTKETIALGTEFNCWDKVYTYTNTGDNAVTLDYEVKGYGFSNSSIYCTNGIWLKLAQDSTEITVPAGESLYFFCHTFETESGSDNSNAYTRMILTSEEVENQKIIDAAANNAKQATITLNKFFDCIDTTYSYTNTTGSAQELLLAHDFFDVNGSIYVIRKTTETVSVEEYHADEKFITLAAGETIQLYTAWGGQNDEDADQQQVKMGLMDVKTALPSSVNAEQADFFIYKYTVPEDGYYQFSGMLTEGFEEFHPQATTYTEWEGRLGIFSSMSTTGTGEYGATEVYMIFTDGAQETMGYPVKLTAGTEYYTVFQMEGSSFYDFQLKKLDVTEVTIKQATGGKLYNEEAYRMYKFDGQDKPAPLNTAKVWRDYACFAVELENGYELTDLLAGKNSILDYVNEWDGVKYAVADLAKIGDAAEFTPVFTKKAEEPVTPPSGDGGGGYVPPAPTTPKDEVTNEAGTTTTVPTTNADMSQSTTSKGNETTTTVDQTVADKIVENAVANKSEEVVIDATSKNETTAQSTKAAEVELPADTLQQIAEKTEADVTIKTDVAEVKLDNTAAAAVAEQAEGETVRIVAEKIKENADEVHVELKIVSSNGKTISEFDGGNISVTVPAPKGQKNVVCVYIDEQGHMHKVPGQLNADGTYTFTTDHFSTYAIMAAEEAEAAIEAQKAAVKEIKFKLNSKLITTKKGKKAVKLIWDTRSDLEFDGAAIYRSTKKNSGYGKKPFFTTTKDSYINTAVKKGTKYYYKVRGFVYIDGEKVYTDYSTKAWRTVK